MLKYKGGKKMKH